KVLLKETDAKLAVAPQGSFHRLQPASGNLQQRTLAHPIATDNRHLRVGRHAKVDLRRRAGRRSAADAQKGTQTRTPTNAPLRRFCGSAGWGSGTRPG